MSSSSTDPDHHTTLGRIRVPGPFVVLQGVPGDGRANTMDYKLLLDRLLESAGDDSSVQETPGQPHAISSTLPPLNPNSSSAPLNDMDDGTDFIVIQDDSGSDVSSSSSRRPAESSESVQDGGRLQVNESWIHTSDDDDEENDRANEQMMHDAKPSSNSSTPTLMASDPLPATVTPGLADAQNNMQQSTSESPPADPDTDRIAAWQASCRQNELHHRQEWLQSARLHQQNQVALGTVSNEMASLLSDDSIWWQCHETHRLAVFDKIPTWHDRTMVSSLAPGMTVVGVQLVTLDSETLLPIASDAAMHDDHTSNTNDTTYNTSYRYYPKGRPGQTQVLQIESPCSGYIVLSRNGYPTALPGLPLQFGNPTVWLWIVTCPAGAVVREGLDLSSPQMTLLPYGSVVQVTRKVINAMGLSRLQVHVVEPAQDKSGRDKAPPLLMAEALMGVTPSMFPLTVSPLSGNNSSASASSEPPKVEGWCSEYLNPLSGQRGAILQPLPLPCPVQYRVVLEQGAVLRSGVELSSPQIGHVPMGATVTIVGRKFSDHPTDRCIERLELAGNGGWMSCRLNKRPPEDFVVVECVGLDGSFDANDAGRYHLQEMRRVQQEQQRQAVLAASSILPSSAMDVDEDGNIAEGSSVAPTTVYNSAAATRPQDAASNGPRDTRCLICLSDERSATLVHGETGHIACCLLCARILKARSDPCPVCRMPIDMVIQHFWAHKSVGSYRYNVK